MKQASFQICIFIFLVQRVNAQILKTRNYAEHYYKGLRYGLYKPTKYDEKKTYPLVVYLHGSNDTISRDLVYYQQSIQEKNPSFVLTPKCGEPNLGWGDTWHEKHTPATTKTLMLIDSRYTNADNERYRIFKSYLKPPDGYHYNGLPFVCTRKFSIRCFRLPR